MGQWGRKPVWSEAGWVVASEQRAAEECCFSLRGTPSVIAVSSFGSDAKPTKYNWELGCRIPVGSNGYSSVRLWVWDCA